MCVDVRTCVVCVATGNVFTSRDPLSVNDCTNEWNGDNAGGRGHLPSHDVCLCNTHRWESLRYNDNRSSKNGSKTLTRMNFSGYVGHVTIFS